jgi:aminoglycoside phosphotransferase (APT) family kinase protein
MNLQDYLPCVVSYLKKANLGHVPGWQPDSPFRVLSLAQGEYNMNYRIRQGDQQWVFRVNVGTQIGHADQITYEFKALRLLGNSGVTPRPYFCDDTLEHIPHGVLLMEYLPGEPLDYRRDLEAAAGVLARIHSQLVNQGENHLIREEKPLSMTFEECSTLLQVYQDSELADPIIKDYMSDVIAWAGVARHQESYFLSDPWPCIINTEVNSGNFIANRTLGTLHLVDWEKPLWGDPSQDLSHFCVPTTTLWKTDYCMPSLARRGFMDAYRDAHRDAHLRDTIEERVRLRDPFNCLRGISWSAMAWVTYQTGDHAVKNESTFRKVSQYLNIEFLRSLFDPFINHK